MKTHHFTTRIVGLLLILLISACSATHEKRSIGEVIDDAVVTNKLKTKFMKDKGVQASQIDIDTWKGVVSLRGTVDSQDQIDRAIEIAERQAGVREVKSYLVVAESGRGKRPQVARSESKGIEEVDLTQKKSEPLAGEGTGDEEENFVDEEFKDEGSPPQVTPE